MSALQTSCENPLEFQDRPFYLVCRCLLQNFEDSPHNAAVLLLTESNIHLTNVYYHSVILELLSIRPMCSDYQVVLSVLALGQVL